MGEFKINNTKHLRALITQAKSESNCFASNKSQLHEIESLSLQIHKNYLTAITEQEKISKNILSLETNLEESIANLEYYKDALIRLLIPHEFNLTLV